MEPSSVCTGGKSWSAVLNTGVCVCVSGECAQCALQVCCEHMVSLCVVVRVVCMVCVSVMSECVG